MFITINFHPPPRLSVFLFVLFMNLVQVGFLFFISLILCSEVNFVLYFLLLFLLICTCHEPWEWIKRTTETRFACLEKQLLPLFVIVRKCEEFSIKYRKYEIIKLINTNEESLRKSANKIPFQEETHKMVCSFMRNCCVSPRLHHMRLMCMWFLLWNFLKVRSKHNHSKTFTINQGRTVAQKIKWMEII